MLESGKVRIECDYDEKLIRVYYNFAPEGFHPLWQKVAECKTSSEYYHCEFTVGAEKLRLMELLDQESDAADSGFWFWRDVEPQVAEGEKR